MYEDTPCRSPHGGRGLKLGEAGIVKVTGHLSLPSRGAWIETLADELLFYPSVVAPLTGGVD